MASRYTTVVRAGLNGPAGPSAPHSDVFDRIVNEL